MNILEAIKEMEKGKMIRNRTLKSDDGDYVYFELASESPFKTTKLLSSVSLYRIENSIENLEDHFMYKHGFSLDQLKSTDWEVYELPNN